MDMDFTKVSFDADLDDIEDADELRGMIRAFAEAQDSNISEFEKAKETIDGLEGRVGEAQEFKSDLAEDLAEVSPLSEDEALTYDMSRLRELITEFSTEETEEEEDEPEGNFNDMGERGGTHSDEDTSTFAEETIEGIDGLHI